MYNKHHKPCKTKIIQLTEPSEIVIRAINGPREHPELFAPTIYKPKNPELSRDDFWWKALSAYYDRSPIWRAKSDFVLKRDPICTGCGKAPSTQAHHLKYPKAPAWPGSEEWDRQEKLFDLTGVCDQCHLDVHPKPQTQLLFENVLRPAA
jgi:hypothetical protein